MRSRGNQKGDSKGAVSEVTAEEDSPEELTGLRVQLQYSCDLLQ